MKKYDKLLIWGDSLFQGITLNEETKTYIKLEGTCCADLAAKELDLQMENAAHFGYISDQGKRLLRRKLILDEKAGIDNSNAIGLICFGGNDADHYWDEIAKAPDIDHVCRASVKEFKKNMEVMVEFLREKNVTPVMMNLPAMDAQRYFNWITRDFTEEDKAGLMKWLCGDVFQMYRFMEYYNDAAVEVANNLGCMMIDIRSAFLNERGCSRFLCLDGIHPNEEGHKFIADIIVKTVKEKLVND